MKLSNDSKFLVITSDQKGSQSAPLILRRPFGLTIPAQYIPSARRIHLRSNTPKLVWPSLHAEVAGPCGTQKKQILILMHLFEHCDFVVFSRRRRHSTYSGR